MPTPFGRYELLERISVGGMAEVFKASVSGAAGFEKIVAIKRILPSLSHDQKFVAMFIQEARISSNLNHPNIGQVYDFGEIDSRYFIALEFIHGKDLRSIQDHLRLSQTNLPVGAAIRIVLELCSALDYAHSKRDASGQLLRIIHRDVSPQNVLISVEGAVKLIDFGIAKPLTDDPKTHTGLLKGKFAYMSPEMVEGKPIDSRSDLFSLGIVLCELVTGERLFFDRSDIATLHKVRKAEVRPPSQVNRNVPPALDTIVLKALARRPEDRYQRAEELYEALDQFAKFSSLNFSTMELSRWMATLFGPELAQRPATIPLGARPILLEPEPALETRVPTPIRRSVTPPKRVPDLETTAVGEGSTQRGPLESSAAAVDEAGDELGSTRVSSESAALAEEMGQRLTFEPSEISKKAPSTRISSGSADLAAKLPQEQPDTLPAAKPPSHLVRTPTRAIGQPERTPARAGGQPERAPARAGQPERTPTPPEGRKQPASASPLTRKPTPPEGRKQPSSSDLLPRTPLEGKGAKLEPPPRTSTTSEERKASPSRPVSPRLIGSKPETPARSAITSEERKVSSPRPMTPKPARLDSPPASVEPPSQMGTGPVLRQTTTGPIRPPSASMRQTTTGPLRPPSTGAIRTPASRPSRSPARAPLDDGAVRRTTTRTGLPQVSAPPEPLDSKDWEDPTSDLSSALKAPREQIVAAMVVPPPSAAKAADADKWDAISTDVWGGTEAPRGAPHEEEHPPIDESWEEYPTSVREESQPGKVVPAELDPAKRSNTPLPGAERWDDFPTSASLKAAPVVAPHDPASDPAEVIVRARLSEDVDAPSVSLSPLEPGFESSDPSITAPTAPTIKAALVAPRATSAPTPKAPSAPTPRAPTAPTPKTSSAPTPRAPTAPSTPPPGAPEVEREPAPPSEEHEPIQTDWDDGPTIIEPEGSPALAALTEERRAAFTAEVAAKIDELVAQGDPLVSMVPEPMPDPDSSSEVSLLELAPVRVRRERRWTTSIFVFCAFLFLGVGGAALYFHFTGRLPLDFWRQSKKVEQPKRDRGTASLDARRDSGRDHGVAVDGGRRVDGVAEKVKQKGVAEKKAIIEKVVKRKKSR